MSITVEILPEAQRLIDEADERWSTEHGYDAVPPCWTTSSVRSVGARGARYSGSSFMAKIELAAGVVHEMPADLRKALLSDKSAQERWQALTPLGRNEFLCWVEDAKQLETRKRRIERTREELIEGKRRPCCWAGCIHRTDKPVSLWAQRVLIDKEPKPKAKAKVK